jgi:hypothetical protein
MGTDGFKSRPPYCKVAGQGPDFRPDLVVTTFCGYGAVVTTNDEAERPTAEVLAEPLLCAICIANRGPGQARIAKTILAGIAVCLDSDDEDGTGSHFDAVWRMLTSDEHELIAQANGLSVRNPPVARS